MRLAEYLTVFGKAAGEWYWCHRLAQPKAALLVILVVVSASPAKKEGVCMSMGWKEKRYTHVGQKPRERCCWPGEGFEVYEMVPPVDWAWNLSPLMAGVLFVASASNTRRLSNGTPAVHACRALIASLCSYELFSRVLLLLREVIVHTKGLTCP